MGVYSVYAGVCHIARLQYQYVHALSAGVALLLCSTASITPHTHARTSASLRPTNLLNSADFPTLGLPTSATCSTGVVPWCTQPYK